MAPTSVSVWGELRDCRAIGLFWTGLSHFTAMVTVFETASLTPMTTGTAAPLDDPDGTSAFTWYSPNVLRQAGEQNVGRHAPPMVTVGVVVVDESGLSSAGEPLGGWSVTGPRPAQ